MNLHGFAEGIEIPVVQMLAATTDGELQVTFIEGVGLNVSPQRIEAYVFDVQENTLATLDKVLANFTQFLPHTPVRAVGCNLQFVDAEPTAQVIAFFDTPEGLEAEYQLLGKQLAVQVEVDGALLNFARRLSAGSARYNFNYHHALERIEECAAIVQGMVPARRDQSVAMLRAFYGYEDYEVISFASELGKATDGNETTDESEVVQGAAGPN